MNLSQIHMDMAASIQAATEEIVLKITRFLSKEYKIRKFMYGWRCGLKLCCKW